MFYIRLKQNYLEQDLKNAITTLPENRRKEYVKTANQLVDNLTEVCMLIHFLFLNLINSVSFVIFYERI
jgi:hypothetical protein